LKSCVVRIYSFSGVPLQSGQMGMSGSITLAASGGRDFSP
jgi:hypothetical protein